MFICKACGGCVAANTRQQKIVVEHRTLPNGRTEIVKEVATCTKAKLIDGKLVQPEQPCSSLAVKGLTNKRKHD